MTSYRIGFIIEQTLGHVSYTNHLLMNVPKDPTIQACWGLPTWTTAGLLHRMPLYNRNWTIQAGWQARQAVRRMNTHARLEALFFHTQVTAILSPDWLKRIPCIISLDATPLQYDALGNFYGHVPGPDWLERWKRRLNRKRFLAARQLVTWSHWAKQGLVEGYGITPDKITVLFPGINLHDWGCPESRRHHHGPVKILFVGGHLERKGGQVLLEAFRGLRQYLATLASGPRDTLSVELHVVTQNRVPPEAGLFVYNDLKPNSPRLRQLYRESHIFCLPTYGDCLPMALVEAAAAGLPMVATRVAAIPEIVQDGKTGFLVPTGEARTLMAVLQRLVMEPDLRFRLGRCAIETAQQNFDAEQNTSQLLGLLKRIVEAERRILKGRA